MYNNPYYKSYMVEDSPINTLEHYSVLGMKWGVRRYQNADGTLTAAGKSVTTVCLVKNCIRH